MHQVLRRIREPHRELLKRYRFLLAQRDFRRSLLAGIVALIGGWFVNYFAIQFATDHASNSATDIILSNIPVFHVADLFIYGTLVFAVLGVLVICAHPKRAPFALKAVALFWVIRSLFTMLTHIAPFEAYYVSDFGPTINDMFFGGDLFFSAHTGMPFLGALAFWREKGLRNLWLLGSAYFAVIVLLGHLHYSIDVLSAFFITYGIFHIALWLFPKDYAAFQADELANPVEISVK